MPPPQPRASGTDRRTSSQGSTSCPGRRCSSRADLHVVCPALHSRRSRSAPDRYCSRTSLLSDSFVLTTFISRQEAFQRVHIISLGIDSSARTHPRRPCGCSSSRAALDSCRGPGASCTPTIAVSAAGTRRGAPRRRLQLVRLPGRRRAQRTLAGRGFSCASDAPRPRAAGGAGPARRRHRSPRPAPPGPVYGASEGLTRS